MSYYIYIVASFTKVIYIGVTNNLERRVFEHKEGKVAGFTKKYRCRKLVYMEEYADIAQALEREKQLKGWKRYRKVDLIECFNPLWRDMSLS